MADWKTLLANVKLVTMDSEFAGSDSRWDSRYGVIDDAAVGIGINGRIDWIGKSTESASHANFNKQTNVIDGMGRLVTPGFIDCHTHLVYAGSRAREWEQRLAGASYEEIARQGGGILSTVTATRAASQEELADLAVQRAQKFLANGVTTIEIKSGYGLDIESELKMLQAAAEVAVQTPMDVSLTLLAAHTIPPEFIIDGKPDADGYIGAVVLPLIQQCKTRVDAVDIFCESIAFDLQQTERVLTAAVEYEIPIKIHAEQLSNLGGAKLAANLGAWSADHLEYLDEAGVIAMGDSESVAVLLPGAYYFLNETQKPPIQLLRDHNVSIALATDHNPGSSPMYSLPLAMNMAATFFGLTAAEIIQAVTINAAQALRRDATIGSLKAGKKADMAIWAASEPAELAYRIGDNLCCGVIKSGELVVNTDLMTENIEAANE